MISALKGPFARAVNERPLQGRNAPDRLPRAFGPG